MTEKEFAKIVRQFRVDRPEFLSEEWQFDQWYKKFGKEDYGVVSRAADFLIEEYAYPPMTATLSAYIKRVKSADREKEEQAKRIPPSEPVSAPKWLIGYGRFLHYLQSQHIDYAAWNIEKIKAEKAKFEKEHPNWKPRPKRI